MQIHTTLSLSLTPTPNHHFQQIFSQMLTSQGLVLATAMAVSAGTLILFDLFRHQHPTPQVLKSCLSSGSRKEERESKKKKKKRVKFAEDVRDSKGNGELYRKKGRIKSAQENQKKSCGNEKMASNHAALYSGILRDRVHRIECCY